MPISVEELFSKQRPASSSDLQECGWLQAQFAGSFGSGGVLGAEVGMDGHLWIMLPVTEQSAAVAAKGAGMRKPIQEMFPNSDARSWKLHAMLYKFARGFFRRPIWVCTVHLNNSRKQILFGCIAASSVRQFASDFRLMIDHGIPTFESAPEAYEAAH